MNIKPHFKPIVLGALLTCISFYGYSAVDDSAVVIVKGSVTKGTCAFTLSDQAVKFSQSILMQNVDETPDMEVVIKAGSGTQIANNKISPVNNPTNASFALYDCKDDHCSLVNFNAGTSSVYITTGNGNKNKDFEVELVKKDSSAVNPGTLKAILALTLIQP